MNDSEVLEGYALEVLRAYGVPREHRAFRDAAARATLVANAVLLGVQAHAGASAATLARRVGKSPEARAFVTRKLLGVHLRMRRSEDPSVLVRLMAKNPRVEETAREYLMLERDEGIGRCPLWLIMRRARVAEEDRAPCIVVAVMHAHPARVLAYCSKRPDILYDGVLQSFHFEVAGVRSRFINSRIGALRT